MTVLAALHPPGDFVSDTIRATGEYYEIDVLEEIRRRVRGGTLVDAGAMIGNHAAYLAEFVPHAAIHAFEPIPANVELLRLNVRAYPSVKVQAFALSDRHRTLRMTADPNMGHSRVVDDGPIEVTAVPLDALELTAVTLLKIDVEGHEPEVLAGAARTIERCHPLILIEDWEREYAALLPAGYRLAADWGTAHQTYLYEWAA